MAATPSNPSTSWADRRRWFGLGGIPASSGLALALACAPTPSDTEAPPDRANPIAPDPDSGAADRDASAGPDTSGPRPDALRFAWPSHCTIPVRVSQGEPDLRAVADYTFRFEPSSRDETRSTFRLIALKHISLAGLRAEDGPNVAASLERNDADLQYYPPIELDATGRYVGFEPTTSGAESWAAKMHRNWRARVELWIDVALRVGETSTSDGEFPASRFGPLPTFVRLERLPDHDGRVQLRRFESARTNLPVEAIRAGLVASGEREDLIERKVELWAREGFAFELELRHDVELDPATLRPYRVETSTRERTTIDGQVDDFVFVREEAWDWARATDCE